MRPEIPLLTSAENIRIWKQGIQRLFRANGVTQAEVASRMAKIVRRTTGETTSATTFISALSRFVNAKNSAFPSWFEKVDSRLLPLALAIGLEDDQVLWSLLHQSAGQIGQEQGVWHADWPSCHVQIPIHLSGKPLSDVATDIQQHYREMQAIHQYPWFFIIGPNGSGCRTIARMLNTYLSRPFELLEFADIHQAQKARRVDFESKIVIVRYGAWSPNGLDIAYNIPTWGIQELRLLVEKLCPQVDLGIAASLQDYLECCELNANMLGFDLRAKTLISSLATVVRHELPSTPEKIRLILAKEQWRHACVQAPALSSFGLSSWSYLCWKLLFRFPEQSLVSRHDVQEVIESIELHYGFELHNTDYALQIIDQLESLPKKKQSNLLSDLKRWVNLSTSVRSIEILLQSGLFTSDNEQKGIILPMQLIGWACLFPEGVEVFPATLSSHPNALSILVALSARGLGWGHLVALMAPFQKSQPLLVSKLVVIFTAQQDHLISISLLGHLALVSSALFQPTIVLPHEREMLISALQKLSQRYAEHLPIIQEESAQDLWALLPESSAYLSWQHPSRAQLQALLPYQCPPRSIASWHHWHPRPPLSIKAHLVLNWHTQHGDVVSAQLLAESYDYAVWHQLPPQIRLMALQVAPFSDRTSAALCHLIDRLVDNQSLELSIPPRHFDLVCTAVSHLGWANISSMLRSWFQAEMDAHNALHFGRAKTAILLVHHFQNTNLLFKWWDRYWMHIQPNLADESYHTQLTLCVDFAILVREHDYQKPLQTLWLHYSKLGRTSAAMLLHKSLSARAPEPILKWLNSNWEPPELREALRGSAALLELAWRHRGTQRTAVLLQWAGLQSPTPRWALHEAMRDAQNHGHWPRWLAPNRPEVTDIVRWMCVNAVGENQFWWAVQLHRHFPWTETLCTALRFWLLEDPLPFSTQPWAISEPLSIHNTPPLEPSDKLQICAQAISEKPEFDWVVLGLKRLWKHHQKFAADKDIFLLGSILLPLGEIDLLREGERLPESFVRRQLPFVLLRTPSVELRSILVQSTAKRSFIIPAIYEELLRRGYPDSIEFFEYQFQKSQDIYWLISLAKYVPERVHPLLLKLSMRPDQIQPLLSVLLPMLPVVVALKLQHSFVLESAEEIESSIAIDDVEKI